MSTYPARPYVPSPMPTFTPTSPAEATESAHPTHTPDQGPYAVLDPSTHRTVGFCAHSDREFWTKAGYIVQR